MAETRLIVTLAPGNKEKGAPRDFLGVGANKEAATEDARQVAKEYWYTHLVEVLKTSPLPASRKKKAPAKPKRQSSAKKKS